MNILQQLLGTLNQVKLKQSFAFFRPPFPKCAHTHTQRKLCAFFEDCHLPVVISAACKPTVNSSPHVYPRIHFLMIWLLPVCVWFHLCLFYFSFLQLLHEDLTRIIFTISRSFHFGREADFIIPVEKRCNLFCPNLEDTSGVSLAALNISEAIPTLSFVF